ncbi:MAG: hypothetical protein A3D92_11875 [Bacteroidetes bacterium RIFCSPHIGHO2_02_FULL_44_7]|nr:MAG: hypothetical protein A3D92_11875 [Bacteroidetes bacterium RIFCSPHIGHO2_02_FULL_44_7]
MKTNINSLFNYEHRYTRPSLAGVTSKDLETIWSVYKKPENDTYFRKALNMLAFLDAEKLKKELHKAISNPKYSENRRIVAIGALNELADAKSEKYYLTALTARSVSEGEKLKLLQGLSRFGTKISLFEVQKMKRGKLLRQLAIFTELLISAREGIVHKLIIPLERSAEVDKNQRAVIKEVVLGKTITELDDNFGLQLASQGQEFICGRSKLTMLMEARFSMGKGTCAQLVGVISSQPLEGGSALTKMIVVLNQSEGGKRKILVFRKDGLLAYGGELLKDGSFELYCTKKFGSDLALLKGAYQDGKLNFSHFEVANTRASKQMATQAIV